MSVAITGGALKGLPLKTKTRSELIRPTSGKVRQALCSMLEGHIEGARAVDLYAGSGAVGFEFLSRGATKVVAVESHAQSLSCLQANTRLVLSKHQVNGQFVIDHATAEDFCSRPECAGQFDLVFVDPPFDRDFSALPGYLKAILSVDGIAVVQFPTRKPPAFVHSTGKLREYGESSLAFFDTQSLSR